MPAKTTGWAILHEGLIWPWTGAVVYRTREGAIHNWCLDSGRTWRQWHRMGTRAVRVRITQTGRPDA
jgi:hypothetical protein